MVASAPHTHIRTSNRHLGLPHVAACIRRWAVIVCIARLRRRSCPPSRSFGNVMPRSRQYILPEQKELFTLMSLEGLSTEQIASATGIQRRVIQRTLKKWRERLRVAEPNRGGKHPILNWIDQAVRD